VVLVAGLIWYLIARDTPEEHPWVRAGELKVIVDGRDRNRGETGKVAVAAVPQTAVKRKVPWSRIFRSKEILALTGSYFTFGYVAWIFFSWFYIYLVQVRGLNLKTSALYSMFPFIAMTLGSLTGGVASDWLSDHVSVRAGRCFLPAFALAFTAFLLSVGSRAHDAKTATLVLACGAGALYLSQSSFWSVTADFAGPYSAVVSGTMNTGCQLGGAVTASLTPMIASHFGWDASFMTATLFAVLGAIGWLIVNPSARLDGIGGAAVGLSATTQPPITAGAAL
jgi:ACS family glucarate transporter-like MFS transporter